MQTSSLLISDSISKWESEKFRLSFLHHGGIMSRFSLRDLFLLVAIIALVAGWWSERRTSQSLRQEITDLNRANYFLEVTARGYAADAERLAEQLTLARSKQ